jgi:hypothetical protein
MELVTKAEKPAWMRNTTGNNKDGCLNESESVKNRIKGHSETGFKVSLSWISFQDQLGLEKRIDKVIKTWWNEENQLGYDRNYLDTFHLTVDKCRIDEMHGAYNFSRVQSQCIFKDGCAGEEICEICDKNFKVPNFSNKEEVKPNNNLSNYSECNIFSSNSLNFPKKMIQIPKKPFTNTENLENAVIFHRFEPKLIQINNTLSRIEEKNSIKNGKNSVFNLLGNIKCWLDVKLLNKKLFAGELINSFDLTGLGKTALNRLGLAKEEFHKSLNFNEEVLVFTYSADKRFLRGFQFLDNFEKNCQIEEFLVFCVLKIADLLDLHVLYKKNERNFAFWKGNTLDSGTVAEFKKCADREIKVLEEFYEFNAENAENNCF